RARTYYAADVGRDHQQVFVILTFDVIDQQGRTVDVVYWNAEETLDLLGVQVNGQDAVYADGDQHVGYHLGADGDACGAHSAILAGIAEIGDHSSNTVGRGAVHGISHQQQFHETVIGGGTGWLDDEHIHATHVFLDFDVDFTVAEAADSCVTQGDAKLFGDLVCQYRVGVTGEYHQIICHGGPFRILFRISSE